MPGNPFKAPAARRTLRPRKSTPSKPAMRAAVPAAKSPIGVISKPVGNPLRAPKVRVTSKAKRSVPRPAVRQGATLQQPGRTGGSGPNYE